MEAPVLPKRSYRFGLFQVDAECGQLLRQGVPVKVQEQPLRVLCLLLERAGETVTREELRQSLWPEGTYVDFDVNLNAKLKLLRFALGDDAENPIFIETVPRRGYRFIAPVQREAETPAENRAAETPALEGKGVPAQMASSARRSWLGAAAVLVFTFLLISGWLYSRKTRAAITPGRNVIAVLPFANQGAGPDLDYLSYAIGNELVTELTHSAALSVRPFSSTSKYGSQPGDLAALGKQMRVTHILTGGYLLDKQELHVNLELVDVAREEPVWRDEIVVSPQQMVALRNLLTERASRGLLPAMHIPASSISGFPAPQNERAYRLYLHSLGISHDPGPNRTAIANLEESGALDGGYPPTWTELQWRYYINYTYGSGGDEERDKAIAAHQRLKELDPHGTANTITLRSEQGELNAAYDEAASLLQRRPDSSDSHYEMSYVLRYAGLLNEAGKECDAALAIDPGYSAFRSCALPFIWLGDYAHAGKYIQLDENTGFAAMLRLEIALRTGNTAGALAETDFASQTGITSARLVRTFLNHGSEAELNNIAAGLEDPKSAHDSEVFYRNAETLSFCGKPESALRELRKSIAANYCSYPGMDNNPLFDPIRHRPEFIQLRQAALQCQQNFNDHRKFTTAP